MILFLGGLLLPLVTYIEAIPAFQVTNHSMEKGIPLQSSEKHQITKQQLFLGYEDS